MGEKPVSHTTGRTQTEGAKEDTWIYNIQQECNETEIQHEFRSLTDC
jgi:hypothetical protein